MAILNICNISPGIIVNDIIIRLDKGVKDNLQTAVDNSHSHYFQTLSCVALEEQILDCINNNKIFKKMQFCLFPLQYYAKSRRESYCFCVNSKDSRTCFPHWGLRETAHKALKAYCIMDMEL